MYDQDWLEAKDQINGPTVAIIVDAGNVESLARVFPDLKVGRFDFLHSFLGFRVPIYEVVARKQYALFLETRDDSSLWHPEIAPIRFSPHRRPFVVDVMVAPHTACRSLDDSLFSHAAARRWTPVHPTDPEMINEPCQLVTDDASQQNSQAATEVVILDYEDLRDLQHTAHWTLHRTPDETDATRQRQLQSLKQVLALLPKCHEWGWMPAPQKVNVHVLSLIGNTLADSRNARQLVLPISDYEVRSWIDQGLTHKLDQPSGVLLVEARNEKYPTLVDSVRLYQNSDIFNAAKAAETVVFMCHHCSTNSPGYANSYLAWLKTQHPNSSQSVRVLAGGIGGFFSRLWDRFYGSGLSREDVFKLYAVPGTEKFYFP